MTENRRRTTSAFLRPIDLTFKWKWLERTVETIIGVVLAVLAAVLSPIMEKNPVKMLTSITPFVLSMSRITVAVFTYVMAVRLSNPEVTSGWPEYTFSMMLVIAIPLLGALGKISAQEMVAFGTAAVNRFGVGGVANVAPPHPDMDQDERDEDDEKEDRP